jgi:hypothetical protein
MDLYNPHWHFPLDSKHPDFPATGLTKDSYISGEKFFEVPIDELGRKTGILQGNLAKDFDKWIG